VDALLGAAGFNARRPEQYCLPRSALGEIFLSSSFGFLMTLTALLEPPSELLQQIFPWVESEHVALNARAQDNRCLKDIALRQFLKLLLWLRTVLLQDAAVLYPLYPHSRLFSYQPFNTKLFREFATSSVAIIAHAESEARLAYENMPEHLVAGLRGSYAELRLEQRREQEENARQLQALGEQYAKVEGLLSRLLESAQPTSRKGHKGVSSPFHFDVHMS
jgi:hypothetical protein